MTHRGLFILFFIAAVSTDPASAADSSSGNAKVPGDDIFGFTSPSDVGNAGDSGFANENDGRFGKRQETFRALNTKYEFSRTVAEGWWMAGSLFGAYYRTENVPGVVDINRTDFDGLSFEIEHRVVERSIRQPFAVSLSIEPRWSRLDGTAGMRSNSYGAALKLFVDAPIVPNKLYWAANLIWTPQRAEDPSDTSQWLTTSSTLISTAVTYQIDAQLFAGVEVRYLSAFGSAWLRDNLGNALYLGPTILWKINEKLTLNATFQPQVAGRSAANPDLSLDLDNFERAQFRVKLAVGF